MKLVRAPCGNEGDTTCAQMCTELAYLNEIFFLGLCRVTLESEWISAEVVQGVAEA